MASLKQDTSFGPGIYRGRPFNKQLLEEYAEGTNRAIAAGIPIPLLKRHAPIDADDNSTQQFADVEGVGWVKRVGVGAEGNLWWEADGVPSDVEQAVKEKRHRYTSPEFRPKYSSDKQGVYTGKLIRHIAFSIRPGNPLQSPIETTLALDESETSWQFDETERKPLEAPMAATSQHDENSDLIKKKGNGVGDGGEVTPTDSSRSRADSDSPLEDKGSAPAPGDVDPNANPDLPPKATDKSKLAAIRAGLAQKNVVVPSDWDPTKEGAMDILLGCLNSAISAENKAQAEAEPEEDPNKEPVSDAPMPFDENSNGGSVMFSPEEIALAPEPLRKKMEAQNLQLKESNERVQQFDEERRTAINTSSRDKAVADVTAANIPPGLKNKLLAGYKPVKDGEAATIQFDEGEEQPTFTAVQVAQMVAESIPPNMQFDETQVGEAKAPKGQRQIGVDQNGKPVYGPATSEQFFESEEGALPSGHVSDEEAERLVAANPVFAAHARGPHKPSLAAQVAENTRNHPSTMVQSR